MNKKIRKISAVFLSVVTVACGALSSLALADNSENSKAKLTDKVADTLTASNQTDSSAKSSASGRTFKDETVYAFSDADGYVDRIIVSDWLKNLSGADTIKDVTELEKIENVKGDEQFTVNRDNTAYWQAAGNDIYYQGETGKTLPVELSITYTLNGRSLSYEEIKGKNGKITMRFSYENLEYETVSVNGETENIYVPFAVLTGLLLDNEVFRNVEVKNGKFLNDGDRTVVIGVALPGMQESLGIGTDTIVIPDYFEVTADAKDFSLDMAFSIMTNSIFNNIDLSKLESTGDINIGDSIAQLTEGMNQLIDGSSQLYDGIDELLTKSSELISGVGQLYDGAKQLYNGADELDDGVAELRSGVSQLAGGINQLAGNSAALNDGAKQVFEGLLETATNQLTSSGISIPRLTVDNYHQVLEGVIPTLGDATVYQKALETVTAEVEKNRPRIVEAVTAAVREQVAEQVIPVATLNTMTKASYDAMVAANMVSAQVQSLINNAINEQMQTDNVKGIIKEQTEIQVQKAITDAMNSDEVKSKLSAASEGISTISGLITSLDSVKLFYQGVLSYTAGVNEVSKGANQIIDGTKQLKDGSSQLKDGAKELYNGIGQLNDQLPALIDGVQQLKDGALQLKDGLNQFNEEGISKIAELANIDIEGIMGRIDAIRAVSKNYKAFAGIDEACDGQVKFICRITFE